MTRNARIARDLAIILALIGLTALIGGRMNREEAETASISLKGPFYAVDGDTLWIKGERLRLEGLDAPERAQTCTNAEGRAWDCGLAARTEMATMAGAANITCEGHARDRYHRLLVVCRDGDTNINARIVRLGLAVSYGGYRREERQARHERLGVWAGPFEKPKDWRAEHGGEHRDPVAGFVADLVSECMDWLSDLWAGGEGASDRQGS